MDRHACHYGSYFGYDEASSRDRHTNRHRANLLPVMSNTLLNNFIKISTIASQRYKNTISEVSQGMDCCRSKEAFPQAMAGHTCGYPQVSRAGAYSNADQSFRERMLSLACRPLPYCKHRERDVITGVRQEVQNAQRLAMQILPWP